MIETKLYLGDAREVIGKLSDNSIEALVTDPPAGIGFMGKEWDSDKGGRDQWIAWLTAIMLEVWRVLKPGAHGLVWALPRTSHWTATALESAGFEVRDVVMHLFGQGFPKSLDVSKAIDKAAGLERARIPGGQGGRNAVLGARKAGEAISGEAIRWNGWGTALKPAAEHWILVRKPISEKTVAENVLRWGTGALNIDGGRIGTETISTHESGDKLAGMKTGKSAGVGEYRTHSGRFPAHLILDEEAGALLDAQSGERKAGGSIRAPATSSRFKNTHAQAGAQPTWEGHGDTGGASRFFYCAKASRRERGEGNRHPTVKPLALMRYLIRLITPPGGTVLDCFAGSGTTGVAAKLEGFGFLGIEREKEYHAIAKKRIKGAAREIEREPVQLELEKA